MRSSGPRAWFLAGWIACEVVIDFCAGGQSPGFCLSRSQPDPDVVEVDPDGCWVNAV
jgi:hypothetical protein